MYLNIKLKKLYYIFVILLVFLILLAFFITIYRNAQNKTSRATKTNCDILKAQNEDDIIKFVRYLGWDIEEIPVNTSNIEIPAKFDKIYEDYNNIQRLSGFDLRDYKGKRVKRYSYKVLNFPYKKDVLMNILVYDGKIIGGDIMSPALDGFMYPLIYNTNSRVNT